MDNKIMLELTQNPLKILFIAPFNPYEAIYSTGILNEIAKLYPRSTITIVTSYLSAPLFAAYPMPKEIISAARLGSFRILPHILKTKWDIIIDCENSRLTNFLRTNKKVQKLPLNSFAEMINLPSETYNPSVWLADEMIHSAEKRLFKRNNILAIAPFNDNGTPILPYDDIVSLLLRITAVGSLFASYSIAVFGFEKTRVRTTSEILSKLPEWQRINLVGSLGLLSIEACLERCKFFIGGDTIISHMANVAKIASLVIMDDKSTHFIAESNYQSSLGSNDFTLDNAIDKIEHLWHSKLSQK